MKKNLSILIFIFIVGFAKTNAQESKKHQINIKTTWGIKAEANVSNFFISGTSVIDSKMKLGFTAGAFLNLEFTGHFALQGELIYHYKSSKFDREDIKGKYQYWGMEIPVYAIYQWKLRKGNRFYMGIGPYAEFGFSAELKRGSEKIDLYKKGQISGSEISAMKDSNVGFGIIIGYEFANGIQLNSSYKIGMTDILDANSNSVSLQPNTISLGIGYRFR